MAANPGAVLVRDIRPTSGSGPGQFAAGPDLLFFVANDGGGEVHPWLTDGTAAGTKKAEIPGVAFDPGPQPKLVRLGDRILFSANDWSVYGRELWAIDHPFFADGFDLGTTAGLVRDRAVGPGGQSTPSAAAAACTRFPVWASWCEERPPLIPRRVEFRVWVRRIRHGTCFTTAPDDTRAREESRLHPHRARLQPGARPGCWRDIAPGAD